jgi:hypothetical protein
MKKIFIILLSIIFLIVLLGCEADTTKQNPTEITEENSQENIQDDSCIDENGYILECYFENNSPIDFINYLKSSYQNPVTINPGFPAPKKWVQEEHLHELIKLIDSEEPASPVSSALSSYRSEQPSAVGNEAMFLIEGFIKGTYPPELDSSYLFKADKEKIKKWWQGDGDETINYKPIKDGLYEDDNGNLYFKKVVFPMPGEDEEDKFVRNIDEVHFPEETYPPKKLKDVIDPESFESLESLYFKDKNHVYYFWEVTGGGSMYVVNEANPKTFKVLNDYAVDDKEAFYRGKKIEGADVATFVILPSPYAKDKNNYYLGDEIVEKSDIVFNSFPFEIGDKIPKELTSPENDYGISELTLEASGQTVKIKFIKPLGKILESSGQAAEGEKNIKLSRKVLEASSKFRDFVTVEIGGIQYDIAYDDENTITFIATSDPNFITNEGYSVNKTTLAEIKNADANYETGYEPGWAYFAKLGDNWKAGFEEGSYGGEPDEDSKIIFFFKRQLYDEYDSYEGQNYRDWKVVAESETKSEQDELIIIAKLVKMDEFQAGCGTLYVRTIMEYEVLEVINGDYNRDTIYVAHGCIEMPREEFSKESGTLKEFKVNDIHKLVLTTDPIYEFETPFDYKIEPGSYTIYYSKWVELK